MKPKTVSFKGGVAMRVLVAGMAFFMLADGAWAASSNCDRYARKYADKHVNVAGNVLGGAAAGAIGGTILGGIVRGRRGLGVGAGIGAGVGAIGGGIHHSQRWQEAYDYAYHRCASGNRVRRARQQAPEPWTEEWYAYCEARFRTFDPQTGTYMAYSGNRRFCQ